MAMQGRFLRSDEPGRPVPGKGIKDVPEVFRLHTDPGIRHADGQMGSVFPDGRAFCNIDPTAPPSGVNFTALESRLMST